MNLVKETPGKTESELGERNTREKRDVNLVKETPGKKDVNLVKETSEGKCSHSHKQLELPSTHHLSEAEIVTLCLNI